MPRLSITQKQILLLKLSYEFERCPNFGEGPVKDARSPQLQWLVRTGALMRRLGALKSNDFKRGEMQMLGGYAWESGSNTAVIEVSKAIEDLKLDLELDGQETIGHVYAPGEVYKFFNDLKSILKEAKAEIFVVDPYFGEEAFGDIFSSHFHDVSMKILSKGPLADSVKPYAKKHIQEYSSSVEIRKTKKTHDRVVFIDGTDGWIIGGSLKDGGLKPSYIFPVHPSIMSDKLTIYRNIWEQSTIVI